MPKYSPCNPSLRRSTSCVSFMIDSFCIALSWQRTFNTYFLFIVEKLIHQRPDLIYFFFQREMARIEKMESRSSLYILKSRRCMPPYESHRLQQSLRCADSRDRRANHDAHRRLPQRATWHLRPSEQDRGLGVLRRLIPVQLRNR